MLVAPPALAPAAPTSPPLPATPAAPLLTVMKPGGSAPLPAMLDAPAFDSDET
jgi:hypothetical protein